MPNHKLGGPTLVGCPQLQLCSVTRGLPSICNLWTCHAVVKRDPLNMATCQILEKKWEYNRTVHQLFIDFKKAYDSEKREVLYNRLLEFGLAKKLIRLLKTCLNETYRKMCVAPTFA
jgi:hypothetical protein